MGNCLMTPDVVIRPTFSPPISVNHRFLSGPTTMLYGDESLPGGTTKSVLAGANSAQPSSTPTRAADRVIAVSNVNILDFISESPFHGLLSCFLRPTEMNLVATKTNALVRPVTRAGDLRQRTPGEAASGECPLTGLGARDCAAPLSLVHA